MTMEATGFSATLAASYQIARRHILEDINLECG
jgi:hypothetical protein